MIERLDQEWAKARLSATDGGTADAKGRALEEVVFTFFSSIPGVTVQRGPFNAFGTQQIDVVVANDEELHGLPKVLGLECKNWMKPVGSAEVGYFILSLYSKDIQYGILVAANGVTGDHYDRTDAQFLIATALAALRIKVVCLTIHELLAVGTVGDLVRLIRQKYLELRLYQNVLHAMTVLNGGPRLTAGACIPLLLRSSGPNR